MRCAVTPRRKRAAALLLAVLLCIGLGSCLQHPLHHNYQEVLAYLKERYPGEKIQVSRTHYKEPDSKYESKTDWVWDCYFTDMPEVVFHVRSSWWTESLFPVAGYALSSDAEQVFWQYYLDQYLSGVGSLDAWKMGPYRLEMEYSSMKQVYPAAKELQKFYSWFSSQPHAGKPYSAYCTLTGLPLPNWILFNRDYVSSDSTEERIETLIVNRCAEMLKEYYAFYRLPCPGYMPEKVYAYARDAWPWDEGYPYPDAIRYNGEPIPKSTFAGVGIEAYYVSFGGFYEMLSRLEFDVEGTPEHFSFTGLDGCLYEFSYEFYDEGNSGPKWYFTCDGKKLTSSTSNPLLYLKDERLPDMAGLQITYLS